MSEPWPPILSVTHGERDVRRSILLYALLLLAVTLLLVPAGSVDLICALEAADLDAIIGG